MVGRCAPTAKRPPGISYGISVGTVHRPPPPAHPVRSPRGICFVRAASILPVSSIRLHGPHIEAERCGVARTAVKRLTKKSLRCEGTPSSTLSHRTDVRSSCSRLSRGGGSLARRPSRPPGGTPTGANHASIACSSRSAPPETRHRFCCPLPADTDIAAREASSTTVVPTSALGGWWFWSGTVL